MQHLHHWFLCVGGIDLVHSVRDWPDIGGGRKHLLFFDHDMCGWDLLAERRLQQLCYRHVLVGLGFDIVHKLPHGDLRIDCWLNRVHELRFGLDLCRRRDFLRSMRGGHLPVCLSMHKLQRRPVLGDGRLYGLRELPSGSVLGVVGCGSVDNVRVLLGRPVPGRRRGERVLSLWCQHILFGGRLHVRIMRGGQGGGRGGGRVRGRGVLGGDLLDRQYLRELPHRHLRRLDG